MKYSNWIIGVFCLLTGCQEPVKNTVHLCGQLVNMGTTEVPMRYNGAASLLGDSRDVILHMDAQGRFDTVISLVKPEYYSISRNTLYLTPGDDLKVYITTDNRDAVFQGTGADVNNYMKGRLFPKGGSFLKSGHYLRAGFEETRRVIDSLASVRRKQLENLQNATPEFKALEKARIEADVINSYLCFASYAPLTNAFRGKTQEEMQTEIRKSVESVLPEVNEKMKSLNDDRFLEVAVVRDILYAAEDSVYRAYFKTYTFTDRGRELYTADEWAGRLRRGVTMQLADSVQAFISSMKNKDFAVELENKLKQASRLMPGQPAIDFVMTDVNGKEKKLSEWKGKPIYLDLWATWCGPCIEESPAFTALSQEFPNISFVQISRDTQYEAWKHYVQGKESPVPQYNSVDRQMLDGWQILYIPRFILIDKDFKIVNAYAPKPSSEEIKKILKDLS